jgi:desulfoferrodoxin
LYFKTVAVIISDERSETKMTSYVTGSTIKSLREKKGYTQKQLAELLSVSDKTVSKWETQRGMPDITLIEPISKALGVSVSELISGECMINRNKASNMLKECFYVCPVCGNIIHSTGEGSFSCCGIKMPVLEAEKSDEGHCINIERIENDYFVTINHPMEKEHYISFFSYVTSDKLSIIKLYPEQNPECRFHIVGHGIIYAYCNKHGLFKIRV